MGNCEKIMQQMSLYIDHELDKQASVDFKAHINACENCKNELDIRMEIRRQLQELPQLDLPDGLHNHVMNQIKMLAEPIELITKSAPIKKRRFGKPDFKITFEKLNYKQYATVAAGVIATFFILNGALSMLNASFDNHAPEVGAKADVQQNAFMLEPSGSISGAPAVMSAEPEYGYTEYNAPETSILVDEDDNAASDVAVDIAEQPLRIDADTGAAAAQSAPANEGIQPMMKEMLQADAVLEDYGVKTFYITVEVDDFEQAVAAIEALPGYNTNANIVYGGEQNTSTAYFTRCVAASEYEAGKNTLRSLGDVRWESENEEKITYNVMDTNAALNAKEREMQRLLLLLEKSQSIHMMTAVEEQLGRVGSQRDDLVRQTLQNDGRVQNPCMVVDITAKGSGIVTPEAVSLGAKMKNAFSVSVRICVSFAEAILVGLSGALLPLLVVALIIVVCVWLARNAKRRGKREK